VSRRVIVRVRITALLALVGSALLDGCDDAPDEGPFRLLYPSGGGNGAALRMVRKLPVGAD